MSQPQANNPLSRQTLDQRRAKHAWEAIKHLEQYNNEVAVTYAREAKKLPSRIMTSGLGQALAFINAKAKKDKDDNDKNLAYKELLNNINDWVLLKRPINAKGPEPGNLLASIIENNSDFFRRATDETLAYLQWINRFAEAEGLTDETGQEG